MYPEKPQPRPHVQFQQNHRLTPQPELPAAAPGDAIDRLISYPQLLPEFGIPLSRKRLRILVKQRLFPAPLAVSPGKIAWRTSSLVAYINSLPQRTRGAENTGLRQRPALHGPGARGREPPGCGGTADQG
jgi:predicted DNA-binding transcriptional regulator AlpA